MPMGALIMTYSGSLLRTTYAVIILYPSSIRLQQNIDHLWESNSGTHDRESYVITTRPECKFKQKECNQTNPQCCFAVVQFYHFRPSELYF